MLKGINDILNDIDLTDFSTMSNEVKSWINVFDENYDYEDKINKEDKKEFDKESDNWRLLIRSTLKKRVASLKDMTNIYEELRSHRELLINIPESSKNENNIGEIKNLLKCICPMNCR